MCGKKAGKIIVILMAKESIFKSDIKRMVLINKRHICKNIY